VISLGRFLLERLPLLQLLRVRERDAVDTLQRLGLGVSFPVGGRILQFNNESQDQTLGFQIAQKKEKEHKQR
jgi:hypothetical protein